MRNLPYWFFSFRHVEHNRTFPVWNTGICTLQNILILGRFKVISTLSLPPSLYSLSAEPAIREFNVVHLLPIRYLSIFVYQPEIVECRFLLRKLVPETLTKLCLHDASGVLVKHFASKEFQGLHFEVNNFLWRSAGKTAFTLLCNLIPNCPQGAWWWSFVHQRCKWRGTVFRKTFL